MKWLTLAVLITLAAPALAQPDDDAAKAKELLDQGTTLYSEDADFAAALAAFRASFELAPSWRALNGIGLTLRALGDYVEATRTYEKLLSDHGEQLSEDQRAGAQKVLADLESKIGRITIAVPTAASETRVTLDGAPLTAATLAGPHRVMPGNHAVVATRDGFQPFAEEVTVGAGERREVIIALEPEKEKVVVKVQLEETPLERRMPVWAPWATVAGGAVLAGAGGLFALGASGDYDEFDRNVADAAGQLPRPAEVDESPRESGDLKKNIAVGLFIGGGIAAGVGVALAIINQPRRVKEKTVPRASLLASPRAVGVSVRF